MKIVVRNRIIIALSVLLVLSVLSFAFTQARYSEEKNPGNHTGELDYTIANQVEVATTEQFFAAIENGYSNIKIADAVSNPFLVSGSADVAADLILDLNGHEIQRNSREPMLTIKEGVRMIVTDTSKSQMGSFYNPVGSVLRIDGGVLTVMSNKFESGPRDDEYYSNHNKNGGSDGLQYIGGKISQKDTLSVSYKQQNGDKQEYVETNTPDVPILLPYVRESAQGAVTGGKNYFVNGNIYFNADADYKTDVANKTGVNFGTDTDVYCASDIVTSDTYFYFTIDDQNATSTTLVASTDGADFRYSYYVSKSGSSYSYVGPTETNATNIKVTIYGYHNVIASARNEVAPYNDPTRPSNFAAIKMLNGSMYSRGGEFYSYFGVDTSYCIYADEGSLSVYDGSYTALDEGVAVKCNYLKRDSEFTIVGGSFKSFKGDTIQMANGEMTITGGTFVKDSSSYTEGNPGANNNNSAIKLINGSINLNSAQGTPINFYLAGRYMAAIECGANATIESTGVNYQFGTTNGTDSVTGGNNIGILSEGGNVTVRNCVFIQPGDYSYGIYSYDKTDADTHHTLDVVSSMFSMGGERCTGIYANGGTINIGSETDLYKPDREQPVYNAIGDEIAKGISINNYTIFYLDHVANCYGVYVEKRAAAASTFASDTRINVYAGQFIVGSGYYSETGSTEKKPYAEFEVPDKDRLGSTDGSKYVAYSGSETLNASQLQTNEKVWSAGVYVNDPTATVSLGKVRMIIGGSYSAGVFAEQGHVTKLYDENINKKYNGTAMAKDDMPTTVLFVGTRMVGYNNGGYLNKGATEKNKKWNYLYKHDYDYKQTSEFSTYYDRILNCNSSDDYGIAAKSGNVTLGRVYVNVRSTYSRGIFATSSESVASTVKLENFIANIDNRDQTGNFPDTFNTTTMTIRNGKVEINDGDVRTNGVGIVINNGKLTFSGDIKFQAINASAIYMTSTAMVSGGTSESDNNWTIGENAKVSIFCNIREYNDEKLTNPTPWKLKNVHDRTEQEDQLPFLDIKNPNAEYTTNNGFYMVSYNGINIKGGSVTCDGELVVDFHGVNNQDQSSYDPYNIPIAGCAINVEKLGENDAPVVNLWHAHVTSGKPKSAYKETDRFYENRNDISSSNAGGGISVKGGTVHLGKESDTFYTDENSIGNKVLNDIVQNGVAINTCGVIHKGDVNQLITIETLGNSRYYTSVDSSGKKNFKYLDHPDHDVNGASYDNWKYAVSQTGGPGIKVESGDIIVKHGTYYAAQGNGILLAGGEATVHNGIFKGKNTEWTSSEGDQTGSGLGSYYGFMLRGGGTLTINGGTFEGFNGGAFVAGLENSQATVTINGGIFEDMPERRLERQTTNGFSVGPYATVILGKEKPTVASDVAPKIQGIACGIAVENNSSFKGNFGTVQITIQGGTVVRATKGNRNDSNVNAIWKGNTDAILKFGECTLYQQRQITEIDSEGKLTFSDDYIIGNFVVSGGSDTWRTVVVDVNTYNIYAYEDENNFEKITDYDSSIKKWCYKLVITKQTL